MLKSDRLLLFSCNLEHLEWLETNPSKLEQHLGISIPNHWTEFPEVIPYSYNALKLDPSLAGWWTHLFIHAADKVLIGFGGFKGKPDDSGMVEIGYEIMPSYQNQGLATETVLKLIDHAFAYPFVTVVQAHTLAAPNASTRVLQKVGMKQVEAFHDPEDGDLWRWQLNRNDDGKDYPMIPTELLIEQGEIELNAGRPTVTLMVANTGDRPIQIGSHFHF